MNAEFLDALRQLEKDKEIPAEELLEMIEQALSSAYRKTYSQEAEIRLRPDPRGRGLRMVAEKEIVDDVENEHLQVSLAEAQRKNPQARVGEYIEYEMSLDGFGRIAAQTMKQVVVQRIREAERERVYDEFGDRVGEVVTAVVQRREQRHCYVLIGRTETFLPYSEQVPGEPYRFNDRVKVYVLEVKRTTKGPQVIVSRSHPSLIRRLFELEVPEIEEGIVTIKSVAREPGARSKIAVASTEERVDPVGACVGHRGSRVQAVVSELYGEKIDIIRWHDDPAEFIREALSPAKPMSVTLDEEQKSAYVVVPDAQLSLAIGKEGQNVRLAARLSGWRIDIRGETQDRERRAQEQAAALALQLGEDEAAGEAAEPVEAAAAEPVGEVAEPVEAAAAEPVAGEPPAEPAAEETPAEPAGEEVAAAEPEAAEAPAEETTPDEAAADAPRNGAGDVSPGEADVQPVAEAVEAEAETEPTAAKE